MSQPTDQTTEPLAPPQPETPPEPSSEPSPQPSRMRRVMHTLFSSETRTGRVLRPILRWLGTIVGLTGFGVMLAYLFLVLPLNSSLNLSRMQLAQSLNLTQQRETDLKAMTGERDGLQKNLAQAKTDLEKAKAKNDLLLVIVDVNNARVALVNKDGAGAKSALENALVNLAQALPVVQQYDKAIADVLKSRLELANKELVIDPLAAQTDLEKLQVDLLATLGKAFK